MTTEKEDENKVAKDCLLIAFRIKYFHDKIFCDPIVDLRSMQNSQSVCPCWS